MRTEKRPGPRPDDRTPHRARSPLATARIESARGTIPASQPARGPAYLSAKTVGSFVPQLTRKAFEKYGFSTAVLIMDWERIVGRDLARTSAPERLKWPRGVETYGEIDDGAAGRPGATLVLRVDPARALDIEYAGRQIVERINAFFGYRAVAELRLVQAPLDARAREGADTQRRLVATPSSGGSPGAVSAETGLSAALDRLGRVLGAVR